MNHRARRSWTSALALIGMLSLALTGCSESGTADTAPAPGHGGEYGYSVEDAADAPEIAGAVGEESMKSAEVRDERGTGGLPEARVIVTGSLHLTVDDPVAAAVSAQDIVAGAGGRTDFSSQTSARTTSVHATYRIPADDYDNARARLRELGTVTREETSTEEAGARIADLDARASALQSSIARLRELMGSAGTTSELLEAERELTSRQAELDSLAAEREWYSDQVRYSTLDVVFSSASAVPAPSASAWERSWSLFSEGMGTIGYVLIIVLPWVVLASIILIAARAVVRRSRRARASGQKAPLRMRGSNAPSGEGVAVPATRDAQEPESHPGAQAPDSEG